MVAISKKELREKIIKEKVVENYKDLESQLTPNGIDIRVCAVLEIKKAGEIGLTKDQHKKPIIGKAWVLEGYEKEVESLTSEIIVVKEGEKIELEGLKPYLVVSCEKINCPKDWFFSIEIKSSLFRLAQMILETAFGEADYHGKLTFMLLPTLPTKLAIGAGIAQVSFFQLSSEESYNEQKNASYQGGRII